MTVFRVLCAAPFSLRQGSWENLEMEKLLTYANKIGMVYIEGRDENGQTGKIP